MKKYVTGIAAVILAISASAFTKATAVKDGEFYLDSSGQIVKITTEGECLSGTPDFCKYHLKEGAEDNGVPENYEGEGASGRFWQP